MRRLVAAMLCAAMVTTGCASASGSHMATTLQPGAGDTSAMADYVQRLAAGSRVRVERTDGATLHGTLMKATADSIVVQKNTRIPEPPVEVPLAVVARVTVEHGSSSGRSIALGIVSGVAVFLGILAILAASIND